ncbi:hypothetical protein NQZ68_033242 [Dissostichus eleginoides]|nr:hypothetical protein NQZ68_033242 [Dissostichus eleginoides]
MKLNSLVSLGIMGALKSQIVGSPYITSSFQNHQGLLGLVHMTNGNQNPYSPQQDRSWPRSDAEMFGRTRKHR